MEENKLKKLYWTEAATGGLILGVAMFVLSFISYYFDFGLDYGSVISVIQIAIIAVAIYLMGRRMAQFRGSRLGFTYGQAMGYTLALMLFTGFIYGLGEYFLQIVIDPAYFDELFEAALYKSGQSEKLIEQAVAAKESMGQMLQNPAVMVISGMFSMLFTGGVVGLIVSIFIKKAPDPFADDEPNTVE